ncbi:kinase-like domain-containing protein [Fomes fomentarius]|nr:kinase-like domain-containing protein [Fomes fomentarius]
MASTSSSSSVDPNDVYVKFTASELFWKDRQQFLQSRGYMLRPRYRPGWIPSWKTNPTMNILNAEDRLSFRLGRSHLMDATNVSDGKLVLIKKVVSNSPELHIATCLSSKELRKDPRNHCVPILDAFVDTQEPAISFIVMPFLRPIDKPEFDTVGSILNCVDQLLEGLIFLHEHNVAHRDCAYNNVMMDASAMYPQGFHPIAPSFLPNDVSNLAPVLPRASVPVTYYYVDFGISTLFTPEETNRMVTGWAGLDRDVPELSNDVPYDPFKVDIFILGNLFKQSFLDKFSNVDILSPLIFHMLKHDPAERPNAPEALSHLREISQSVWAVHRLWRAKLRSEDVMTGSILDTLSLVSRD